MQDSKHNLDIEPRIIANKQYHFYYSQNEEKHLKILNGHQTHL